MVTKNTDTSFKLLAAKAVEAGIAKIKQASADMDLNIHVYGLQCMAHAAAHGDIRLMDALKDALPRGYFGEGFRQWVYKFSPIRWDLSGKIMLLKEGEAGYRKFNLAEASDTNIEKNTPRRNEAILDLDKIVNFVKGLEKRVDNAKEKGTLVTVQEAKMRRYVKALLAVEAPILNAKEAGAATPAEQKTGDVKLIVERPVETTRKPRKHPAQDQEQAAA